MTLAAQRADAGWFDCAYTVRCRWWFPWLRERTVETKWTNKLFATALQKNGFRVVEAHGYDAAVGAFKFVIHWDKDVAL